MTTMQDKITERLRQLAEQAGLEFIIDPGLSSTGGAFRYMTGWDTHLRIRATFEYGQASFILDGQAMTEPDLEFFKERLLFTKSAGARSGRTLEKHVEYSVGEHLRKFFQLVADLLAPYAVKAEPAAESPKRYQAQILLTGKGRLDALYWTGEAALAAGLKRIKRRIAAGNVETVLVTGPDNEVVFASPVGVADDYLARRQQASPDQAGS